MLNITFDKFKRFSKTDWCGLAGAENFSDDSEPFIGYLGDKILIVADSNGIDAMLDLDEDCENSLRFDSGNEIDIISRLSLLDKLPEINEKVLLEVGLIRV